jgi:hypothetical protein
MALGPFFTDKLPDLDALERSDQPGAGDETDQESRNHGADGAERYITKYIERGNVRMQ